MLITFEGGEGAGKTTLINRIYDELARRGKKALKTRAPGGTGTGNLIRELLLHRDSLSPRCELLLFLADRAQHTDEVIIPALKEKITILCDRFNDSTMAYQGGARGIDEEFVRNLCSFATNKIQPDITLYLDLDPALGLSRVARSKDRIESEGLAFHERIRKAYLNIAKKEPKRFFILDASLPPEEVYTQAMRIIDAHR